MEKIRPMTDMALSPREQAERLNGMIGSASDQPKYPYGLCISLSHNELEKLGVDYEDWTVGDLFHLHAMAKITSISRRETEGEADCRVEMQIIALAGENEDEENKEYENDEGQAVNIKREMMRKATRSPYQEA